MYFLTLSSCDGAITRSGGYYSKLEDVQLLIEQNRYNLCEAGRFVEAYVEEIGEGYYRTVQNRWVYKWNGRAWVLFEEKYNVNTFKSVCGIE